MTTEEDFDAPVQGCRHANSVLAERTLSNGGKQIVRQCASCGNAISSAIKRATFTAEQIANMPAFDESIRERYDAALLAGRLQRSVEFVKERPERQAAYQEYLKSPRWFELRGVVLSRDKRVCQSCLTRPATQVHHLEYPKVWGEEAAWTLVSICNICHEKAHA